MVGTVVIIVGVRVTVVTVVNVHFSCNSGWWVFTACLAVDMMVLARYGCSHGGGC